MDIWNCAAVTMAKPVRTEHYVNHLLLAIERGVFNDDLLSSPGNRTAPRSIERGPVKAVRSIR